MKNNPGFKFRQQSDGSPILTPLEIDEHASFFLNEYSKKFPEYSIFKPQPTPIENIIENYCGISIDYQTFSNSEILGMTARRNSVRMNTKTRLRKTKQS